LTLTFKLINGRNQTHLPCEFGANPFRSSRDISYTNKKVTDSNKNKTSHSSLHAAKTKAKFSCLEMEGPILVLMLHKFVTYLLRHLPTYSPGPTPGVANSKAVRSRFVPRIARVPFQNSGRANPKGNQLTQVQQKSGLRR